MKVEIYRYVVEGPQPVATFVDILEQAAKTDAATTSGGQSCADGACPSDAPVGGLAGPVPHVI